MSRLKRNIVRRDRACVLYERAKESRLLNVERSLIALLRDIPCLSFTASAKPTPEWHTLSYVAQTAALCGLWDTDIRSVEQVMVSDANIDKFQHRWAVVKQKTPCNIVDFLNIVHECNGCV